MDSTKTSLKFSEENYPDYYKNCADLNNNYQYSSFVVSRNGISSECGLYADTDTDKEIEKLKTFLIRISEKLCAETLDETQSNLKCRNRKFKRDGICLYRYQTLKEFETLNFEFCRNEVPEELFQLEEAFYRKFYVETILLGTLTSVFNEREITDLVNRTSYDDFCLMVDMLTAHSILLNRVLSFADLLELTELRKELKMMSSNERSTLHKGFQEFLTNLDFERSLIINAQQKTFKTTLDRTALRYKLQFLSDNESKFLCDKLKIFFAFTRICFDFEFYFRYISSKEVFKQKYSLTSIELKKHFQDFNEVMTNSKYQLPRHKLFSRYLNIFIIFIFDLVRIFEDDTKHNRTSSVYTFLQVACKCIIVFIDRYGTNRDLAKLFYSTEFRNYFKNLAASVQWQAQAVKNCQESIKLAKAIKNKTTQTKSSIQITESDNNCYEILHEDGSVSLMCIGGNHKAALQMWSNTLNDRLLEVNQSLSSFIVVLEYLICLSSQIDILCAKPLFESSLCLSFPYQKTLEVFLLSLLENVDKNALKYSVETETLYRIVQIWLLICVVHDVGKDASKKSGIFVPRPIIRKIFQQYFRDIIKNRNYLKQFIKSENAFENLIRWMPKHESAFFFDSLCKSNLMTVFLKHSTLLEKFLLERKQEAVDLIDLFSSLERNRILRASNRICKEVQLLHQNSAILKRCTFRILNNNKFAIETFKST